MVLTAMSSDLLSEECRFLASRGLALSHIDGCDGWLAGNDDICCVLSVFSCGLMVWASLRRRGLHWGHWMLFLIAYGVVRPFCLEAPPQVLGRCLWAMLFILPVDRCWTLRMGAFLLLCAVQPYTVLLAPLVLYESPSSSSTSHSHQLQGMVRTYATYITSITCLVLIINTILLLFSMPGISAALLSLPSLVLQPFAHSPSLPSAEGHGVFWYLQMLMLPEYASYFSALLAVQPVLSCLFAGALTLPLDTQVTVKLFYILSQYYLLRPDLLGILTAMLSLLTHAPAVTQSMRHLPWITMGITVPLFVSPVMRHLWVDLGTGNANFVFFQGLCMWVSLGLLLLELVTAMLRVSNGEEKEKGEATGMEEEEEGCGHVK